MYDVAGIAWGRAKVAVVGVMKQLYFVHLSVTVRLLEATLKPVAAEFPFSQVKVHYEILFMQMMMI